MPKHHSIPATRSQILLAKKSNALTRLILPYHSCRNIETGDFLYLTEPWFYREKNNSVFRQSEMPEKFLDLVDWIPAGFMMSDDSKYWFIAKDIQPTILPPPKISFEEWRQSGYLLVDAPATAEIVQKAWNAHWGDWGDSLSKNGWRADLMLLSVMIEKMDKVNGLLS